MSAYIESTAVIKSKEGLLAALNELGYKAAEIEVHDAPQPLVGYAGDTRADLAHIIVRRRYLGFASNDIGFLRQNDGSYRALVSEYDEGALATKHSMKGGFTNNIITLASVHHTMKTLTKQGKQVSRVQRGDKIVLQIRS